MKDLSVKIKVDMSEFEESLTQMEARVGRLVGIQASDSAVPLALLGAYAAGTKLRRPVSRRTLLMGSLR